MFRSFVSSLIAITAVAVSAGNESVAIADSRELLFTVEISRHCERAPGSKVLALKEKLAKDPNSKDGFLGPSMCTKAGVEHHHWNGEVMREFLGSLISDKYDLREVYTQATSKERTQESAVA